MVPYIRDEASGPSYSVPALCQALAALGNEVELHVLLGNPPEDARYRCITHGEWAWPRRLHISPQLKRALADRVTRFDILHNHGLWTLANVYPGQVVTRGSGCRLVASPRGTLASWALQQGRWRKRLMWWLCQANTLRRAACLHATSEAEYRDLRAAGLRAPVALIPNGIDIPPASDAEPRSEPSRRLLFLGRLHPVKGVDVLLGAWRAVQESFPNWELHIVGPSEDGTLEKMQRLGRDLGVERVDFPGPVYGDAKRAAYRSADLFVLPSHTENFGVAVAEALAHGLPAIVSRNAPWPGLETHGCGWWIEQGESALAECLGHAMALPRPELAQRGAQGRAWMERDFSWQQVGDRMQTTYHWLIEGGAPPSWVRRD
ncbi:MAG: glycosyltransferase [Acidobacteriota bacterium]